MSFQRWVILQWSDPLYWVTHALAFCFMVFLQLGLSALDHVPTNVLVLLIATPLGLFLGDWLYWRFWATDKKD